MRRRLFQLWDSDLAYAWRSSHIAVVASIILLLLLIGSLGADWVAPHNPFDLASINLIDALTPPIWMDGGNPHYLLGTDSQGRDLYSSLLYGMRVSLFIGVASVLLAMALGVVLGLISGYVGGRLDAFIMRVADVQLSFPAIR